MKNKPDDFNALEQLAFLYKYCKNDCGKAEPILQILFKKVPRTQNDDMYYVILAECQIELKDYQGAINNLKFAFKKTPQDFKFSILALLGKIYKEQGKKDLALEEFQKSLIFFYSSIFYPQFKKNEKNY